METRATSAKDWLAEFLFVIQKNWYIAFIYHGRFYVKFSTVCSLFKLYDFHGIFHLQFIQPPNAMSVSAPLITRRCCRRNKERSTWRNYICVCRSRSLGSFIIKFYRQLIVYCRRPRMLNRLVLGFSMAPSKVLARLASLSGVLYFAKERSNLADVVANWEVT